MEAGAAMKPGAPWKAPGLAKSMLSASRNARDAVPLKARRGGGAPPPAAVASATATAVAAGSK